ncbi:MAG: HAD-IA family hydrolase [Rhizobiaceae bacterium]|nr:HAD-IA family hydrolase [Rhizobiaceae bacterium]
MKALMMDVDGVLVRLNEPWHADLDKDLGISVEQLQKEFFMESWSDIIIGKVELREGLSPVLASIAPRISTNEFINYWFEKDSRLDQALLELLKNARARGIRIYGATNQEHERATYLWHNLGLSTYWDGFCYSAALSWRKPDDNFFQQAMEKTGFAASELLLVDDTHENIVAARSAGWQALHWSGDDLGFSRLSKLIAENQ